jgi:hypothetical protein
VDAGEPLAVEQHFAQNDSGIVLRALTGPPPLLPKLAKITMQFAGAVIQGAHPPRSLGGPKRLAARPEEERTPVPLCGRAWTAPIKARPKIRPIGPEAMTRQSPQEFRVSRRAKRVSRNSSTVDQR